MPTEIAGASKTYSPADLREPATSRAAAELRKFARRLSFRGARFAVNGVLKLRFRVREHKLWEYARGLAFFESAGVWPAAGAAPRIFDFGGAATLPVLYLASRGGEVLSADIDAGLSEWTNRMAARRGWRLRATTHNLLDAPAPAGWGLFDAVMSFSVLEHIAVEQQERLLAILGGLLRPGGVFALTFDYGPDAPQAGAVRDAARVERLILASGLALSDARGFCDSGQRFALDNRHPTRRFTFGSLFLRKPAE